MLHRLVYISTARALFSDSALLALLDQCRAGNQAAGITGLLLYSSGNFIQLLEGEAEAVRALYAKISADPRHHNCIPLIDRRAEDRLFAAWSMGFRPAATLSTDERSAISNFLTEANSGAQADKAETPTALKLLERFARTMR